jgi:hypothetical protein
MPYPNDDERPFKVEEWSGTSTVFVLAEASDAVAAKAAFNEYVATRPHRRLTLRCRGHVIREHIPEPPKPHTRSGR